MTGFPLPMSEPISRSPAPEGGPLVDTFGRRHTNLRISVTDRCNLRCRYCMPEDVTFLDRTELLSFEELACFVRIATPLGIDRVRLTGGEPLLRKGLDQLVEQLVSISGLRDIALTTNGILLAEQAGPLWSAGLRRVTVSLDTLEADRFHAISRRDGLDRVLAGIEAARAIGFLVKLNAVVLRGINDVDIAPLAQFARKTGCEMRFIESMPIGAQPWQRDQAVLAEEIIATITREVAPVRPIAGDPHAPAEDFEYVDGGKLGVIASVSRPFCRQCNRLRLMAEGRLRNCLFALDEVDVKPAIRRADEVEVARLIRQCVWQKWEGHEINSARFQKPERTMHAIGG